MSLPRPECGHDCLEFVDSFYNPLDAMNQWNPCIRSVRRGHLACLRYAHEEEDCPWDEVTCRDASGWGHLDCLRYAHENGCPWDADTCCWASNGGQLECLRYAHEHGCPWDDLTTYWASRNGHLECLRYAHQHGCPWTQETCRWASRNGHLDCLRYAHEHGCPWDEETCVGGAVYGEQDCLRYALENGCPIPDFTMYNVPAVVVPYLYHYGIRLSHSNSDHLKDHIRKHVRKAWRMLRCATTLIGAYRNACERVYSPDGVGYREAETSFRKTVCQPCSTIGDFRL